MDSIAGISYEPETRPGVANLLSIFAALTDETPQAVAERYADKGNAALKNELAELVIASLAPIQQRYHELRADQGYLETHPAPRRGTSPRPLRPNPGRHLPRHGFRDVSFFVTFSCLSWLIKPNRVQLWQHHFRNNMIPPA